MKVRIITESLDSMMKSGDLSYINQAIELAVMSEEIPEPDQISEREKAGWGITGALILKYNSYKDAKQLEKWLQSYGISKETKWRPFDGSKVYYYIHYEAGTTEPNSKFTKVIIQALEPDQVTFPVDETRDVELELITEAVENIIPPSFSKLIEIIKEKLPEKADQDIFAQYLTTYGPANDGRGSHFNSALINHYFKTAVQNIPFALERLGYFRRWKDYHHAMGSVEERDRVEGVIKYKLERQFEVGWIYQDGESWSGESDEVNLNNRYQSAGWVWTDKYNKYIKPPEEGQEDYHPEDYSADTKKAWLTMAQQKKAFTKMVKKVCEKQGKATVHDGGSEAWDLACKEVMKELEAKWERAQYKWWLQVGAQKFRPFTTFLNADKNNHNKLQGIFKTAPKRTDIDHETAEVFKEDAFTTAVGFMGDWHISQEHAPCDGDLTKPCVIKKFSNGKFWFNRAKASCNMAGDKFANCGSAEFDDSILLLLKSGSLEEGYGWHIMLEWNAARKSIIQILGFSNSFPEREHWEEIKSLYEYLKPDEVAERAWAHLTERGRVTKKQIEEFYKFIGYDTTPDIEKDPKDWADMSRRLNQFLYNRETRHPDQHGRDGVNAEHLRFRWMGNASAWGSEELRFVVQFRHSFNQRFASNSQVKVARIISKNALKKLQEKVANDIVKIVEASGFGGKEDVIIKKVNENILNPPPISTVSAPGANVLNARLHFALQAPIWQGEFGTAMPGMEQSVPTNQPGVMHNFLTRLREHFSTQGLLLMGKQTVEMVEKELEKHDVEEDKPEMRIDWTTSDIDFNAPRMNFGNFTLAQLGNIASRQRRANEPEHMQNAARREIYNREMREARKVVGQILAEKKSGGVRVRITEGIDFQIDPEYTVDEHFLDFLGEKIPTLDIGNPAEINAVIKAIENNNSAEEIFKELEQKGIVGRDVTSAFESTAGQIEQIRTIMTSHWFSPIETLNEIKTTYVGGKGWLSGVGKLPVGDNPKGPYPSGGEVAHKIGNYKIKVRTKDIMKEPKKPVVPGEEPDIEFVEDKQKKFACGILPYKGEGENIQFLIGKAPQGWWDFFKGKMDEGETEQEAAKREFEEESSFKFKGSLDDAIELTHKKLKIWLVEMPELDAGQFDVSKVSKITGEYLNGRPEIEEIGWFGSTEAEVRLNKKQRPFIGLAMEKLGEEVVSESKEMIKLRIFDFDKTIEEGILNEALGMIGWHVTNENNRDSIIKTGIVTSGGSTDEINPSYGEGRVYFFSGDYDYDREEDRGFESAKMAMFEENVVGNPDPPYILIPFNLKKVSGQIFPDPELAKHDIYGPDSYYLVGEIASEAIIASHIKHENELKKPDSQDIKENKIKIRIGGKECLN